MKKQAMPMGLDTARAVWPPLRRSGRFPALPYPPQRLGQGIDDSRRMEAATGMCCRSRPSDKVIKSFVVES